MSEKEVLYEVDPTGRKEAGQAEPEGMEEKGVLKLRAPFQFEGQTHTEIPYDFGKVTRKDIRAWAQMKAQQGGIVTNVVLDLDGQEMVFCKAAGIAPEMFDSMDVRDYTQALGLAMGFFGS